MVILSGASSLSSALILVASMVFFAGCVGGGESSTSQSGAAAPTVGPAGFDENTGGIEGTVLTDEGAAVPNAQVGIVGAANASSSTTDVQGRFSLSHVPPGTVALGAQALGYMSVSKSVQVAAGQVTSASFVLTALAVVSAYHNTIPFKGFFDCTWYYPLGSGPCGYIGQTNGTTGNPLQPLWVNSHRKWNYESGPNVMTAIDEIQWKKGSAATGDKMAVIFSHGPIKGKERDGTHIFCQASGFTPVLMKWSRDADQASAPGQCLTGSAQVGGSVPGPPTIPLAGLLLQSFVSAGATPTGTQAGDLPIGATYQQNFDLWVTLFHGEAAPDGFTILKDA